MICSVMSDQFSMASAFVTQSIVLLFLIRDPFRNVPRIDGLLLAAFHRLERHFTAGDLGLTKHAHVWHLDRVSILDLLTKLVGFGINRNAHAVVAQFTSEF